MGFIDYCFGTRIMHGVLAVFSTSVRSTHPSRKVCPSTRHFARRFLVTLVPYTKATYACARVIDVWHQCATVCSGDFTQFKTTVMRVYRPSHLFTCLAKLLLVALAAVAIVGSRLIRHCRDLPSHDIRAFWLSHGPHDIAQWTVQERHIGLFYTHAARKRVLFCFSGTSVHINWSWVRQTLSAEPFYQT